MNNRPENKDTVALAFLGGNICLQQEVQLNTKIKDISYKFYFKKEKVFTIALLLKNIKVHK